MLLLNAINQPLVLAAILTALIIGITIHEFAHAWMANQLGDDTPRLAGRLTLNPLSHLDPMGAIFLLIVGFGWGRPVQFNPSKIKDPAGTIKIALAGVTANFLLALILGLAIRVATAFGIPYDSSIYLEFIAIVIFVNLGLIAFNILPIPPLDGSHLVESFLSHQSAEYYRQIGPIVLFGIIITQQFTGQSILLVILEPIIRLLSFIATGMPSLFG